MSSLRSQHESLIHTILRDRYGVLPDKFEIEPAEHAKNNHVFFIKFIHPTSETLNPPHRLFTSPIPAETSRLVLKIPKDNVGLEDAARVRNEVSFLSLARDALLPENDSLIPVVFDWSDDLSQFSFRWILEEWKAGESVTPEKMGTLDEEVQRQVLGQLAAVLHAFQTYQLPPTVAGFGGLTFDDEGVIKSGPSTIPCGRPFSSYAAFLRGMCQWQLAASERSTHLNGWRDHPKLRDRIDAFFANGLDEVIAKVPDQRPTLVHADLLFVNLLFDRETYRLTAVLDFDFSHIGAPISEYLFSFVDIYALLSSQADPMGLTRRWLLDGYPKKVDYTFRVSKLLDAVLAHAHVQKPSTIEAASHIADVWWFSQELCQAYWFMGSMTSRDPDKSLEMVKSGSARKLGRYLELWGF
ncbi:hypothetical protein E4U42_007876 [Claviceps africana]|uniref:Aminoglycoside phosphotransferase domain-containing protein n=1 Tax=Claviceps africana TaxID=83212 RepID=A0A8K0NI84_9HYPO|nr:hypothetical protein E4U42_007876 [Claviceps africana]